MLCVVSATSRSLVSGSVTECAVSERDCEASIKRGDSGPQWAVAPWGSAGGGEAVLSSIV